MKKISYLYFMPVAVFVFSIASSQAGAQTPSAVSRVAEVETLSSSEWQKTIDDSKREIQDLLRENEKITAEYDFLRERLSTLQANVLEVKQSVEEQKRANEALDRFQRDQMSVREKLRNGMQDAKKEIADIENEKASLLNQLKEEERKTELWQNKLMDLQVRKREQTLDLKLQEISRQELEQGQDEELERLKDDLRRYQEREKSLEARLRAVQTESKQITPEAERIAAENKVLEVKIDQLKTQHDQQKRANDELAKKNEELRKQADVLPADLVKEKAALDADIRKLEGEVAAVRKSVEASAGLIQKKRQIMNEIMRMDAENQELRRDIEGLMK